MLKVAFLLDSSIYHSTEFHQGAICNEPGH